MKLYCFDPVIISDHVGTFHTRMFHGRMDGGAGFGSYLPANFLGREPWRPIKLMRNGRHVPEVFMPEPATLIVSEAVAGRLARLPNLARQPVAFTKLFDFPYRARDFSYVEDLRRLGGRFLEMPYIDTSESEEHFYDVVRDVTEYHSTIGTYYQLIMARLRDVIEKYENLRPISITPQPITGELTLDLSRELLRDYPVFWNKAYFCTEEAFAAFDPALDRDYYYVKCVDVDL